ncbi:MAG: DUF4465 domain-containing protein [Bacteroidia bacterium]|nr:DUF4465 domain-containing protein [Bacteroidia bacterium]
MRQSLLLFILIFSLVQAQNLANFEDISLPQDSFLNGSQSNVNGYRSGNFFFPVTYDAPNFSWSGWSISNKTDTLTAGFTNQYSSITGGGFGGSSNYAISYGLNLTDFSQQANILKFEGDALGQPVRGFQITNSTYAYLSMKNGDQFAKRFGGVDGNDPDFFLLTIKGYFNGMLTADSVDFYLADYRFADNTQDYIVDEWTFVDLSSLGNVDSLSFSLNSSDTSSFGFNTPAYFCMDNLESATPSSNNPAFASERISLYPNPSRNFVMVSSSRSNSLDLSLWSVDGKLLMQKDNFLSGSKLNISDFPAGTYLLKVRDGDQVISKKINKF